MNKDPFVYLKHILDSIEAIEGYTNNLGQEDFMQSVIKQDAVIRRISIIGEAVRNIPTDFRKQHITIPWKDIAGMRDKIIHNYIGVDIDLVWSVVKKDIPPLKKQIKNLLSK